VPSAFRRCEVCCAPTPLIVVKVPPSRLPIGLHCRAVNAAEGLGLKRYRPSQRRRLAGPLPGPGARRAPRGGPARECVAIPTVQIETTESWRLSRPASRDGLHGM
jgi:hypothetical protein